MIKEETKEIDGHLYSCRMMTVRAAHNTFLSLCSTLGGPVVEVLARGSDDGDGDEIEKLIMGAISVAVQNLEGEVGEKLLKSVFTGVTFVGEGPTGFELKPWDANFERHFTGRLFSVYKVWAWAIQVNYKDFLDGAQTLGGDKAKSLGKSALNSLLTSTSESGQSSTASSST